MASYLITGASRGIGLEFLVQLSANPANTVVGLVRDAASTRERLEPRAAGRQNIHILQADLVKYNSLRDTVEKVSQITNGSLDYVIANGAFLSTWSGYLDIGDLGKEPERLEEDMLQSLRVNLIGNMHLFNLFIPLVLKGNAKKVITLSSGHADHDLILNYDIASAAPYTISKAAMNTAVAKYSAQYASQGVLFMSISPGVVDTADYSDLTPAQLEMLAKQGAQFAKYAPHFKGPISPEDSVKLMLSVIDKASVAGGNGGSFVSHLGTKQWI